MSGMRPRISTCKAWAMAFAYRAGWRVASCYRIAVDSGRDSMPELSRFLGIVIGMFYREHGVAHFHAV